jgi:hypothetical protein
MEEKCSVFIEVSGMAVFVPIICDNRVVIM